MVKCDKKKELQLGIEIEMEHSHLFPKHLQEAMSKRIAKDHIKEFPCYYSEGLIPLEKKMKGGRK